ncbi:MAG: threonine-phosphate decarboxylase CobD [Pseudomonadota bacterium]
MNDDLRHGGVLDQVTAQFPDAPEPWIDLSTGINPWPWPVERIDPVVLHRLPTQHDMDQCRIAMAYSINAPESAMTLVPGTELAIRLLPMLLPAKRVVVLSPTYGDHAESWQAAGATVLTSSDPLAHLDDADAVVLCHPNNPDGRCFDLTTLLEAHAQLSRRNAWLIVDEAYAELDQHLSLAAYGGHPNLIVLRSTGKFFGLPGIRLGAVLAPPELSQSLNTLLGVWPMSGAALAIGSQAYRDLDWQEACRLRLAEARVHLDKMLAAHNITVSGGTDLFRFVAFDDAHARWHSLCQQGIYTRRFNWSRTHLRFGLPATIEAQSRLAQALSLQD